MSMKFQERLMSIDDARLQETNPFHLETWVDSYGNKFFVICGPLDEDAMRFQKLRISPKQTKDFSCIVDVLRQMAGEIHCCNADSGYTFCKKPVGKLPSIQFTANPSKATCSLCIESFLRNL